MIMVDERKNRFVLMFMCYVKLHFQAETHDCS